MDDVAHHVRRYTPARAGRQGACAPASRRARRPRSSRRCCRRWSLSRVARRISPRPYDPVAELRPGALNGVFERILDGERRLIERGVSLPFGGSLLVVGRKV